jgi:hypothetical protein
MEITGLGRLSRAQQKRGFSVRLSHITIDKYNGILNPPQIAKK